MELRELAILSKSRCVCVGVGVEDDSGQRGGRPMSSGSNLAMEVGMGGIFGAGTPACFSTFLVRIRSRKTVTSP